MAVAKEPPVAGQVASAVLGQHEGYMAETPAPPALLPTCRRIGQDIGEIATKMTKHLTRTEGPKLRILHATRVLPLLCRDRPSMEPHPPASSSRLPSYMHATFTSSKESMKAKRLNSWTNLGQIHSHL